jgi:S-sulfo-L-cysteine synthase (O-acetyl-L-serine-dependent)
MSILAAIGSTPLVQLTHLTDGSEVRVLAKLEGCNPGGSVKDRPASYMIRRAEESGELTQEKIILEPTSGNTGIALAMIAAARGYRIKLFMPECVSTERRIILEALGAEVLLTPAKEGTDGAIRRAHELHEAETGKYYMPNQYDNASNVLAHYETTGPEIWDQTKGEIDVFVAGMGTGGTLMGTGKYLKERKAACRIVGIEPTLGHAIQGLKNMCESIVPKIYDPSRLDEKVVIEDGEAFEMTRLLAQHEGVFVGLSSGAAMAGALRVAAGMKKGTIVVVLPDRGDRYLSVMQFRSICAKCPP